MTFKILKPQSDAEKTTLTTLDTIEITPNIAKSWKLPPFQRPLRVNEKVQALAHKIKLDGGVIPGVFTLGILDKERYLIDGQHRRESFLLSECLVGYVDVRVCHFTSMAEMGEEFVNLNSRIVQMRPDDIMRGLEESYPALGRIRKRAPYVGYDQIRRGDKSPVVSMSALLRCWVGSAGDVPKSGGATAATLALTLQQTEADEIADFLELPFKAWGRDASTGRLWSNLNLTLCMWIYRRCVIADMPATMRSHKFTRDQFTKCLMSLGANTEYIDWLHGRNSQSRDNSPAYSRIKTIFAARMQLETNTKILMLAPAWATTR